MLRNFSYLILTNKFNYNFVYVLLCALYLFCFALTQSHSFIQKETTSSHASDRALALSQVRPNLVE